MAGSHIILESGKHLFKEGDASDGMYIIRKGDVSVYLTRNGATVELARLTTGAMIGEMALFENRPRSASAKAISTCEITRISKGDFARLTKQIPKWFVTLMVALSSRLRDTNQRLQDAEDQNPTSSQTLEASYRILMLIKLLWYKDGIKCGKGWHLDLGDAITHSTQILNLPKSNIEAAIGGLKNGGLISIELNDYKEKKLAIAHRSTLDTILRILKSYNTRFESATKLPKNGDQFFAVLHDLANESPYDEPLLSLSDIEARGYSKDVVQLKQWLAVISKCNDFLVDFKLAKNSEGQAALKINKKTLARIEQGFRAIEHLQAA